jgi:hypothetical protein
MTVHEAGSPVEKKKKYLGASASLLLDLLKQLLGLLGGLGDVQPGPTQGM